VNNEPLTEAKLYVLFGASGQTGKRLLPLLLRSGYRVRAYLRDPSKITITHRNLELQEGDIENLNRVEESINGAHGVVSLVGHPLGDKSYHGGILLPFIQTLHKAMIAKGIKNLLVQSGAVTNSIDDTYSFFKQVLLRGVFSRLSGDHGVHKDNDQVLAYLEQNGGDISWIVTRPPSLFSDTKDTRTVVAMNKLPMPPRISFQSLAAYTLKVLEDDNLIHTAKYCGYEK